VRRAFSDGVGCVRRQLFQTGLFVHYHGRRDVLDANRLPDWQLLHHRHASRGRRPGNRYPWRWLRRALASLLSRRWRWWWGSWRSHG
jgi:hypothetical protein